MIEMIPKRCEGCVHLRHRMDGDVRVMDQCYVYDRTITDEMLEEPCKFYVKSVKEALELKPCPFCGGKPTDVTGADETATLLFFIMCKKCKVVMKSKYVDEVFNNWNKRVRE